VPVGWSKMAAPVKTDVDFPDVLFEMRGAMVFLKTIPLPFFEIMKIENLTIN
jgi:hypothetical protein